MRSALVAVALSVACGPLLAQSEREPTKPSSKGHTVSRDSQPPKGAPSPAAKMQREEEEERRRTQKQPKPKYDPTRPQHARAKERVPGDPPPKHGAHTVSRDAQPPKGPPSPAARDPGVRRATDDPSQGRTVHCTASPVCAGSYGACQEVAQTYTAANTGASRRDIVRQCVQANTPDTCECAPQCSRVAQCSIF